MEMKFCIDCKWFVKPGWFLPNRLGKCKQPELFSGYEDYLVDPNDRENMPFAANKRAFQCGKEGKYWEAKG